LTNNYKNIIKDVKLLNRFIRQLFFLPDTPSLIQWVASDAKYLALCGAIVNVEYSTDVQFFQFLKAFCHRQSINFQCLQERLEPVAFALGLLKVYSERLDYYQLLGVNPWVNAVEIQKAYRKKVHKVHPDKSGGGHHQDNQAFIKLHEAFQTLSDPELRRRYDQGIQNFGIWYEKPQKKDKNISLKQSHQKNYKYFYQLGGLFLFLIIAAFIFDFFYR
jgi:hypothetical protein